MFYLGNSIGIFTKYSPVYLCAFLCLSFNAYYIHTSKYAFYKILNMEYYLEIFKVKYTLYLIEFEALKITLASTKAFVVLSKFVN